MLSKYPISTAHACLIRLHSFFPLILNGICAFVILQTLFFHSPLKTNHKINDAEVCVGLMLGKKMKVLSPAVDRMHLCSSPCLTWK